MSGWIWAHVCMRDKAGTRWPNLSRAEGGERRLQRTEERERERFFFLLKKIEKKKKQQKNQNL